jgi:uncharacterized membrane protein YqjE
MNWSSILGLDRHLEKYRQRVADVASGAEDRLALFLIEWEEEKQRLRHFVALILVGTVLSAVLMIALSAALVLQFWETPWRLLVTWGVALLWSLAWLAVILALVRSIGRGRNAFAATRRELQLDWSELKEKL